MQQKKILIVDDDHLYLHAVKSFLALCGLDADMADCAQEALSLLQVTRYSMMMTDMHMPGVDGLALSRMAHKLVPDLHIVLVSGGLTDDLEREALSAGVAEVHAKPSTPEALRDLVQKCPDAALPSPEPHPQSI